VARPFFIAGDAALSPHSVTLFCASFSHRISMANRRDESRFHPSPNPAHRPSADARRHARVVTYVADRDFLLPTLVSAEQVQRQVAGFADVVVALLGLSDAEVDAIGPVMADLKLVSIRMERFDPPGGRTWVADHVPTSTLGRFLLPQHLPRHYRHIVYIDGDTQIVGDVRPLVLLDVPEGHVAAAPDCAWMQRLAWRLPESYLAALGIGKAADYFNAGVLAFTRDTFDAAMPEALDFLLGNPDRCRYGDQSALNAVMRGRRLRLSPRYNFLADYRDTGLESLFDPVIRHFAGIYKPWKVVGSPIGDAFVGT
jgi:hypothetical protein